MNYHKIPFLEFVEHRRKTLALNVYNRKEERLKINDLSIHFEKLEKGQRIILKKEGRNVRVEQKEN